jgi:hypothetical protein
MENTARNDLCDSYENMVNLKSNPTFWANQFALCHLILISITGFRSMAQDVKREIIGKIYVDDGGDMSNIQVINISGKKGVVTDPQGRFTIYASVNDSLMFSSIQFGKKVVKINQEIYDRGYMNIQMVESTIQLDEVVVRPYGLSGKIEHDLGKIKIDRAITAETEGLPNAGIKLRTQSERNLYTARTWDYKVVSIKLDPLINAISGRTLMLKKRVARDLKKQKYETIYKEIEDSLVVNNLKIPQDKVYEFYYFCEADALFDSIVGLNVKGDIWDFLVLKSLSFRKNLKLDGPK